MRSREPSGFLVAELVPAPGGGFAPFGTPAEGAAFGTLPGPDGAWRVVFPAPGDGGGWRALAPARLPAHETAWAMTVHKAQGS